ITQRLISILITVTRTGHACKLDNRLWPSGNAGVLVTSFKSYLHYHQSSQPWEHQVLIKRTFSIRLQHSVSIVIAY
ncbi:MAG: hypothetical protein QF614_07175, partial [SAR324 cluster bacterium]|nr:hypothetical protein [SAR324 cluster bacterium]